jgi:hypothetical protein
METEEPTPEQIEMYNNLADDYIKLNFKGQHYTSAIYFVETLLDRLKESQKNSNSPIIKDIFGR